MLTLTLSLILTPTRFCLERQPSVVLRMDWRGISGTRLFKRTFRDSSRCEMIGSGVWGDNIGDEEN